ncbi:MAG: DEAD/DEAH box helicase [Xanthomonadaceae bacterium]|nr:DEAD/DEAH box helicase [Xanthomonadaceae bacterium]
MDNEPLATPAPEIKPWTELGLKPETLQLIEQSGFATPTPVQSQAIPRVLAGEDLIVSAQTGTGKTATFGYPMIERIRGRKGTYGLVLAPSREIALQTQEFFVKHKETTGIHSVSLIGGTELKADEKELASYPQIIVATPGRLCDHIERGNVWLEYVEVLVLDEADRMLEMGFSVQVNKILEQTTSSRQTLLFSATVPPEVDRLARKIMKNPGRIAVGKTSSAAKTVEQNFIFTDEDDKITKLIKILNDETGTVFVFTRSKLGTAELWRRLRSRGYMDAGQVHSDLRQIDREGTLQDFKDGKIRVLIATDVVGRGIHVDNVAHVVNFDLPYEAEDYIHRIGRTGRAGESGRATSLVTFRDREVLRDIEKLIGRTIPRPTGDVGRASSSRPKKKRPKIVSSAVSNFN